MILSENFRPYEVLADFETPVTVFEHCIVSCSHFPFNDRLGHRMGIWEDLPWTV